MNTPSHFMMSAAARKALPTWNMSKSAVWLGSVTPDIPLYLLSFGGLFYFHTIQGWSISEAANHMYDTLYFEDPGWKASHNFFHAPPVILTGLVLARAMRGNFPKLAHWLIWFWAACLLHSVVDIFTHNNDGPLVLWPFDWSLRFSSPISYWDPAYYGRPFALFEGIFDLALSAYLIVPWLRTKFGWAPEESDSKISANS